jgi:hypothetical protein
MTYSLQRLYLTSQQGVARTILANAPIPAGARLLHLRGALDLAAPVTHRSRCLSRSRQLAFLPPPTLKPEPHARAERVRFGLSV